MFLLDSTILENSYQKLKSYTFMLLFAAKILIIILGFHNLDYKKTSLAPFVKVFEQFLENLDRSRKGELLKKSGKTLYLSLLAIYLFICLFAFS